MSSPRKLAVLFALLMLLTGSLSVPAGIARADGASPSGPVLTPPEENSLPIGLTPEEEARKGEIGTYTRDTQPPPGPGIRQCAEWEPVTGALVRYAFGLPYNLLAEIAEDIELWVLVASQSEQNTCSTLLANNGVNMAHVHFIIQSTNSIWTRDYGPQFAFDANGDQGIIDHHYNRPRPLDDVVNYACGTAWSIPVYGSPLIHSGGNYMCDGHNNGFSTDLVYNENPSLTHAQVDGYMQSYLGINTYHVIQDISTSGIHHIDCWAKLLNEETILVKQVSASNPTYTRLEQNVNTMRTWTNAYGRPYKIVRVFCGAYSGDVAAYTNGIVLNKKVLVPTFGISTDAAALQTIRDALPGYEVIGFSGSWLTDDAIHCRVMGIHDKFMLRLDSAALPDTVDAPGNIRVGALIDDRSEAGLKADSLRVFWRISGQPTFDSVLLTPAAAADSFYAYIPAQPQGTRIEYYVFAADLSNRRGARPIPAPAGFYSFVYMGDATAAPDRPVAARIDLAPIGPNPFAGPAAITFSLADASPVSLRVYDVNGRLVATVVDGPLSAGGHTAAWNGIDLSGRQAPDGVYLFRLSAGGETITRRGVLVH